MCHIHTLTSSSADRCLQRWRRGGDAKLRNGCVAPGSGFVFLTLHVADDSLNPHGAELEFTFTQNASGLFWVGNRREPTSETDVSQPTVLEFALSRCRRLDSKLADNRLYMQLARKKPLYVSFPKSPARKIKSPALTNLRPSI